MQMLYVYAPKYESGGKFWPIVHDSTIFSLVLMHFIASGIFKMKKLPYPFLSTSPLPIFTLLFNEYCRKRFLPIFMAYSTEVCSSWLYKYSLNNVISLRKEGWPIKD